MEDVSRTTPPQTEDGTTKDRTPALSNLRRTFSLLVSKISKALQKLASKGKNLLEICNEVLGPSPIKRRWEKHN